MAQCEFVNRNGWGCSNCDWKLKFPVVTNASTPAGMATQAEFDKHVCSQHPRKKSPREDVNQAAARIVREATERD
jgi:hypothetical protein